MRAVMMLMRKFDPAAEETSIHALKAAALSWCAKAGMDPNHRLILGHHVTGKNSLECYARDALAAPLRDFEQVLTSIRTGAFAPDLNRSGVMRTGALAGPAENYMAETTKAIPQDTQTDKGDADIISSSSSSDSSSSDSGEELGDSLRPHDPVAQPQRWDPDVEMYQHVKSSIVRVRAKGAVQEFFSCGTAITDQYKEVETARFLLFRKCKGREVAKPIRDIGQLASALKKQRPAK